MDRLVGEDLGQFAGQEDDGLAVRAPDHRGGRAAMHQQHVPPKGPWSCGSRSSGRTRD
ncbi:hypothetical protein GCM10017776_37570 [Streptomyces griseoluteus]|nr:hypothetical protein GCM10017776_37570 [Streptomyces griseoluteus]